MSYILDKWNELANKYKDKVAIRFDCDKYELKYCDIPNHVLAISKCLQSYSVKQYEKIALFTENHPHWLTVNQAILDNGCTVIPRGSKVKLYELEYIYNHADCSVLVTDSLDVLHCFLNNDSTLKLVILTGENRKQIAGKGKYDIPVLTYEEAIVAGENFANYESREIKPEDMSVITYTSGTSGQPKGVIYSHKSSNAIIDHYVAHYTFSKENDNLVEFLAWWHLAGFVNCFYSLYNGYTTTCVNFENYLNAVRYYKPVYIFVVPKVCNIIFERIKRYISLMEIFNKFNLMLLLKCSKYIPFLYKFFGNNYSNRLKQYIFGTSNPIIMSCSAKINPEVVKFLNLLGIQYWDLYGLTEGGPITGGNDKHNLINSAGKAFGDNDIKIINPETKQELPINQKGLIVAKSSQTMAGYYKNEEATKAAFTDDGYLITGDLGYFDKDGYLFINGRYKDVIALSNGVNVEPIILEDICKSSQYIDQIIFAGQDQAYLTALIYPNKQEIDKISTEKNIPTEKLLKSIEFKETVLTDINKKIFKRSYARFCEKVKNISFITEPFNQDNGLVTNTNKLKRNQIYEVYSKEIEKMYKK